jgi:hypothetical protein
MTEQQALAEAMRRWGKTFPGRVFCCSQPTLMAGVVECPGDPHRGFSITGKTWEEVFQAHDRSVASSLSWKLRAIDRSGRPIVRVVEHPELVNLDWDNNSDWAIRIKRTPRKRPRGCDLTIAASEDPTRAATSPRRPA